MNDRFNFRVWYKPENKYLDGIFAVARSGHLIIDLNILQDYDDKSSDCIIEQCTGLKDKNGNLIYEGDVIKNKTIEYIVKWESCCWVVENKNNVNIGGFLDDFLHCEIIGNIHEQPEQKEA